ncbi:hypothetical protein [Paenibacillus caui]|nr:hypothetical protein [Paenibacillus caui]
MEQEGELGAKAIVQGHGGSIEAYNAPSGGAVFSIGLNMDDQGYP